jgi:hypothetical protein
MKTLDEIPPTWSQALPADDTGDPCNSSRFKCVLPGAASPTGEAVLDRETGLVWERTPSQGRDGWDFAFRQCIQNVSAGNRTGFRLPTVEELLSLIDPVTHDLPTGHPFNVQLGLHWSGTTDPTDLSRAYLVHIGGGAATQPTAKNLELSIWCVRGGHSHGGQ